MYYQACFRVAIAEFFLISAPFRSLQQLLDYDGDDIEDTFCLNFAVSDFTAIYTYTLLYI